MKLLVIQHGALGDLILTFPSLILLRERFNAIELLSPSPHGRLAGDLGLVERWHPIDAACYASLYTPGLETELSVWLEQFDVILIFTFDSEWVQQLAAQSEARLLQVQPGPQSRTPIHTADYLIDQLKVLKLVCSQRADTVVAQFQADHSVFSADQAFRRPIILHPGSGSRIKNWSLRRFVRSAVWLRQQGYRTLWLLGPAEREGVFPRLADLAAAEGLDGAKSLQPERVEDLLRHLMKGGGYIGNDSGVAHLAAFLGLPTVAVFGPTQPQCWRPLGPSVRVVEGPPRTYCFKRRGIPKNASSPQEARGAGGNQQAAPKICLACAIRYAGPSPKRAFDSSAAQQMVVACLQGIAVETVCRAFKQLEASWPPKPVRSPCDHPIRD
jgi:hypothetical protein